MTLRKILNWMVGLPVAIAAVAFAVAHVPVHDLVAAEAIGLAVFVHKVELAVGGFQPGAVRHASP